MNYGQVGQPVRPMQRRVVGMGVMANPQQFATQGALEDLTQPLYDRANYPAAGVSQLSLFSLQIGSTANLIVNESVVSTSKTYRDTNMDNGGVVPQKLFVFVGISINYIPMSCAPGAANTAAVGNDIMDLKNGGFVEFRVSDKPMLYLPLHYIPESNPIQCTQSTRADTTVVSSGVTSSIPFPMYKFGIPVTLNPYTNFRFILHFPGSPALAQAFDIQVALHATMRRNS